MGNPRGFMTVDRQTYSERDPVERIGDWNEFHLDLPIVELQDQGSPVSYTHLTLPTILLV